MKKLLTIITITLLFSSCKQNNCSDLIFARNKQAEQKNFEAMAATDSLIINYCK